MKKNLIALGVSTALAVIAGQAAAGVIRDVGIQVSNTASVAGTVVTPGAASLTKNDGGIGNVLLFPYYTAQGDNATLLNIVNTDTVNGKLVKVRFRGAGNSDDVFDFQVALSPGDVWTAAVSKNADGVASLNTADNSCTLPASVNLPFNTNRLDASSTKSVAEQTLEGYVEVINMADIPRFIATSGAAAVGATASALYTAIKHKTTGAVDCATTTAGAAAFELLKSDITTVSGAIAAGLSYPTTGLAGDWIILNQANTAAWSGSATALAADAAANLVFFPQTDESYTADLADVSTDPVFQGNAASPSTAIVQPKMYDFPDLSTAYSVALTAGTGGAAADAQRTQVTGQLAVNSIANEYVTDDTIAAVTDMLFSQPTRRYWAAVNYTAPAASTGGAATATTGAAARAVQTVNTAGVLSAAALGARIGTVGATVTNDYYNTANSSVVDRLLCLTNVSSGLTQFDRSERTSTSGFVVSPGTSTTLPICGEAAVVSINAGSATEASALNATLARNNIELSYVDGWLSLDLTKQNAGGLPVLGSSFMRASNGPVNYGFAFPHKTK